MSSPLPTTTVRVPADATTPSPAPVDARLVAPGLVAWAAAFTAVVLPVRTTLATTGVVTGVALWAGWVLLRDRGRPGRAAAPARHRATPSGATAAAVLLAALTGLAVLATTAAHVHARGTGHVPALVEDGATVVVHATVRTEPRQVLATQPWQDRPRYRLSVTVQQIEGRGRQAGARAEMVLIGPEAWAGTGLGEKVRARGRLAPTDPGDPAVALLFTDHPPDRLSAPRGHLAVVNALRTDLRAVTAGLSPQGQGLVPGIAVGDDRALPADLREAMRATSLTHLTAVSGAHVAILLGCTLLAVAWLPRWGRVVVAAPVLLAFVALVRPEASVLRAAVMGGVVLLALALGRPARALPALCTAVVALLLVDPWLARSYGFVLSVLATTGLVLLARPWARRLSHLMPRWAATLVAVPAAAQALCAPVVVLLTPAVSTYAVPANVLAAPAVPPATVLGVLATLLAPWWPAAAQVLVTLAAACTWWIALVARSLAALPGAQLPWPAGVPGALTLLLLTGVAVVLVHRSGPERPGRRRRVVVVVVVALLVLLLVLAPGPRRVVGTWLPGVWPPRAWLAVQCDVGQGSALVLRSGPGAAVMVDVGPEDGGAPRCLADLGVQHLDLLVLTHAHADHVGALEQVLAQVTVTEALLTPGGEPPSTTAAVLHQLGRAAVPVRRPTAGASGAAGAVRWQVLWPTGPAVQALGGPDGTNDLSVVVHLATPRLSALSLGDVEMDGQAGLRRRLRAAGALASDVVVMAHHGSSRQDPALVPLLGGRLVLVGVGEGNDYGHPAPSALALYGAGGALVRRTDTCGAVAVVPAEDGGLAVVTSRDASPAGRCTQADGR